MGTTQGNPPGNLDTKLAELCFLEEAHDCSLVLGGPLFQLLRKTHLDGGHLEFLYRRLLAFTLVTWLPLLLLTTFSSSAANLPGLSFFHDVEVHVRFLIALPILIAAELIVHLRLRAVVARFVDWHIILPKDFPRFHRAIQSAIKLRNSIPLEIGLFLCIYSVGLWLWRSRVGNNISTWYAAPGGPWHLSPAGFWYVFISIPIFQFILLRWYVRLFIWFRFLWHVSRIDLNLIPTHPDHCAGLAFLGRSLYAFGPILFAQGTTFAGLAASRVLYRGESLLTFKFQIGGFIAFFVLAILGPLAMFSGRMAGVKRKGLAEYGQFAERYVERFDQKWIRCDAVDFEEVLGTPDIQSLADLGNSFALVRDMRLVPFSIEDIFRLALVTAAPFVPLLLTIWSPEEIIMRVFRIVFHAP